MLNSDLSGVKNLVPLAFAPQSDVLDAPYLRAIAELAQTRGDAAFTPGGGVLLDTPLTKADRAALPEPREIAPRFVDLPTDRFHKTLKQRGDFSHFVETFTVSHADKDYALVVIPISGRLSSKQLNAIANAAEFFGHGSIRLTADVSIRLPNVPKALLRPVYEVLKQAGLLVHAKQRLAA